MKEYGVQDVISRWKDQPKKIAEKLLKQYGPPNEVTSERLIWHKNGVWKRSELINEEIPHHFPEPHKDSLLQAINYRVPPEAASQVLQFDGSIVIERTCGELAARCDDERANYLAINLAHQIINGAKTVDEARHFYAETVQKKMHQEYMEGFLFAVPTADQADPDVSVKAD